MAMSGFPRNHIQTVVAATDLSDTAAAALRWAAAIATDHGAALHIVHALNLAGWATDYLMVDATVPAHLEEATREKLSLLVQESHFQGLDTSWEVVPGEPSEVVLTAAAAKRSNLIVVGTRGPRGLDYLLLGSTARRVVQRASCPVVTVHPQAADQERPVRRILVATDFSDEAESALRVSLDLIEGETAPAELILLHAYVVPYDVLPVDGYVSTPAGLQQWQTAQADVEARLESLARIPQEQGTKVQILGCEGFPPEVILDKANLETVDLIAMGTRGRTGLSHVLLGSTAERVIHRAPCPVLTVRRPHNQDGKGGSHAE